MPIIDLNCDLGESAEPDRLNLDEALLRVVTSANIACGGHAGDETTMTRIVRAASMLGVAVGAHPGYPDRAGFGRIELAMSAGEVERSVAEQVRALLHVARRLNVPLAHVKPHGALYHAAMTRPDVARAVAAGTRTVAPGAALVGLAGAPALEVWRTMGCRVLAEAFADRRYTPAGGLVPRSDALALITDPAEAGDQAVRIAEGKGVRATGGAIILIRADTICVHGDTPGALAVVRAVRARLEQAGITLTATAMSA